MVGRLDGNPAGRFDLQIPLLRAPAACWCARAIVESTLTSHTMSPAASAQICNADKIASHTPAPLPGSEQPVCRLPRPIPLGHVPPWRSYPCSPTDPVDELPFHPFRWAPGPLTNRHQRLDRRPLIIGEIRTPRCRYAGHEVSGIRFVLVNEPYTGDLAHLPATTRENPTPTSDYTSAAPTSTTSQTRPSGLAAPGETASACPWRYSKAGISSSDAAPREHHRIPSRPRRVAGRPRVSGVGWQSRN